MMDYIYSLYTVFFGLATLLFAFGLWNGKGWGWFGTVSGIGKAQWSLLKLKI